MRLNDTGATMVAESTNDAVEGCPANEWITRECSPYMMPDGELIPVRWVYPKYLTVVIND